MGVIFAKETKSQKREIYPHAKISTFTVYVFDNSTRKILVLCTFYLFAKLPSTNEHKQNTPMKKLFYRIKIVMSIILQYGFYILIYFSLQIHYRLASVDSTSLCM